MKPDPPCSIESEASVDALTLCRNLHCELELIVSLVHEGVVEPQGASVERWRFTGPALLRASRALRLARDLEVNPPGVALAMQLLDEINRLEACLSASEITAVDRVVAARDE